MAAKRPFSATRLTFFISLATIIAFFAFTDHDPFGEGPLKSATFTISDSSAPPGDGPRPRRLSAGAASGDREEYHCGLRQRLHLRTMAGNILFQSPNGPDLSHMLSTPGLAMQLRDGNVISWTDPQPRAMAHDNHPLETRAGG